LVAGVASPQWVFLNNPTKAPAMEKLLLDELRTIKLMCIANFIEIQEIKRAMELDGSTREDWHSYMNNRREGVDMLGKKISTLLKDDLPNLWENNLGKREG
jgi:hypothetical protein